MAVTENHDIVAKVNYLFHFFKARYHPVIKKIWIIIMQPYGGISQAVSQSQLGMVAISIISIFTKIVQNNIYEETVESLKLALEHYQSSK